MPSSLLRRKVNTAHIEEDGVVDGNSVSTLVIERGVQRRCRSVHAPLPRAKTHEAHAAPKEACDYAKDKPQLGPRGPEFAESVEADAVIGRLDGMRRSVRYLALTA